MENQFGKYDFAVKLWGDLGCFTRPEFKVDRVTYSVMTPAAARGALEAIFWKPQMRWEIREIWALNPIKEIAVLRNEIDDRQSIDIQSPFTIEGRRQQRATLFLKEPSYLILADIKVKDNSRHNKQAYVEMANRRLSRGECHHQPYLGTRECSAFFEEPNGNETPISESRIIGNMLFDTAFCKSDTQRNFTFIEHENDSSKIVEGYAHHIFFDAVLSNGIMSIPREKYIELYRLEEGLYVSRSG